MAKQPGPPEPGKPIKLNKGNIDLISAPGIYPHSELTGFRLWVSKTGVKSYQVVGKVRGKTVFVTIGKHGNPWTPETARKEAVTVRLLMGQGVNPNQQKADAKAAAEAAEATAKAAEEAEQAKGSLTVGKAFAEFLGKDQKESTSKVYRWVFNKHFKDWLNKPLIDVTKDDILKSFEKISEKSPGSAAHAMRIFRAVFHTAQITHSEDIPELAKLNPVKLLSHYHSGWNSLEPRDSFIHDGDLSAFYKAVMGLSNKVARDYLMVAILTGLRKSEICSLTWRDNIDLNEKTITVTNTKNKQKHILMMSHYLYDLFLTRSNSRDSEYVFPGRGALGHFNDPEKPIKQVIDDAKIEPFSSHSLRRTFATTADTLGYSLNEVQRLLNHKGSSIAERHYIQRQARKTAEPMQRISDHLLDLMGAKRLPSETAKVIPLSSASGK